MKGNILIKVISICVALFLSGCVSLRGVSVTQIPSKRKSVVTAKVERFIIMAFNFDNDYIDTLSQQLRDKCRGGKIQGIMTKDESTSYIFAHKRTVTAKGDCIK